MAQISMREVIYGRREHENVLPEDRPTGPPIEDAPGDSAEVKRYRQFFQTHDINGLPRRPDVTRGSWK